MPGRTATPVDSSSQTHPLQATCRRAVDVPCGRGGVSSMCVGTGRSRNPLHPGCRSPASSTSLDRRRSRAFRPLRLPSRSADHLCGSCGRGQGLPFDGDLGENPDRVTLPLPARIRLAVRRRWLRPPPPSHRLSPRSDCLDTTIGGTNWPLCCSFHLRSYSTHLRLLSESQKPTLQN